MLLFGYKYHVHGMLNLHYGLNITTNDKLNDISVLFYSTIWAIETSMDVNSVSVIPQR